MPSELNSAGARGENSGIERVAAGASLDDLLPEAFAVCREAAKRVPQTDRDRASDIPWRLMTGMRDRLVHDYINVRLDRVWSTVTVDLPALIPAVRRFRDQLIAEELHNSHSYQGRSVFGWEPPPGEGDASAGERAVTA